MIHLFCHRIESTIVKAIKNKTYYTQVYYIINNINRLYMTFDRYKCKDINIILKKYRE